MGKLLLPSINSSDRVSSVWDAREFLYDSDLNNIWFGNGIAAGGVSLLTTGGGGGGALAISAGTTLASTGTLIMSNAHGIVFGIDGQTLTASYTVPSTAGLLSNINISAGSTSHNLSKLTFANSNGVSFGLSGSVITASHDGITSQSVQTQNMVSVLGSTGNISFANSNGVSIGGNASTITFSHNGLTSQSNQAFSAQGGSSAFQTLIFSNSNGFTFSNSGGSIIASYTVPSVTNSSWTASAGGNSETISQLEFVDGNGVSFGLTNGQLTATVKTDYLISQSNQAFSAQGGSSAFQTLIFTNSNGISFSNTNGSIWASHNGITSQTNQTIGLYAVSNTTQSTFATVDARTLSFQGAGIASIGISNGSVVVSVPSPAAAQTGISSIALSNTTYTSGQISFVDGNGISWASTTGQGISITHGLQFTSNTSAITSNALNTSASRVINLVAATNSTGGGTASLSSNVSFSNANNFTFYTSAGNAIVASYSQIADASKAGTGFTSAGAGISLSGTLNTAGLSLSASVTQSNQAFSAGAASSTFQTLSFQDSNGVSFSNNAGAIRLTHDLQFTSNTSAITSNALNTSVSRVINIVAATNSTAGGTASLSSNVSFSAANGVTFYTSAGGAVVGSVVTSYRASNDAIGLNTAQTNVTWTVNSSGISLNAGGYAGTGFTSAGTNISLSATLNTAGLSFSASVAAPGAAAENNWHNLLGANTAGNTTASGSTIGLSGINLTLSGTNNSVINISAPATSSLIATGGVSLSTAGSTITISAPNVATASYYYNLEEWVGTTAIVQTSGSSIFLQPFMMPFYMSAGFARFLMSYNDSAVGTAGTPVANTTFSVERYTTFGLGLYSQGVGASSRSIQQISSTSVGLTGRTIFSAGAQSSQYTITLQKTYPQLGFSTNSYSTSYAASSASIVISSNSNTLFTGLRYLDIPWASSLTPGNYWIGIGASTSSNSNSANISFAGTAGMALSLIGISQAAISVGLLGAATSASDHQLYLGQGVWTTNASGFTKDSIGLNSVSQVVSLPAIPFQLIRQA